MAELLVIRHGQASFGANDYDQLSDLGHQQSAMAGAALRDAGWVPDRLITGTLKRQQETLASMGFDTPPEIHEGLNEYDFYNLLDVQFDGKVPHDVRHDRKTHFRTLRQVISDWQAGGLTGASETWAEFSGRVEAARQFATDTDARRVLVISSGGAIGQLVASTLGAPSTQMVALNLQMKNTSLTRFFFSKSAFILHEFNATPHFSSQSNAKHVSFS